MPTQTKTQSPKTKPSRRQEKEPGPATVQAKAEGQAPAPARSIWRGVISFGMVSIPVKLFPATASKDISFNLLHEKCNSRLRQLRWCPVCDREVKADEIVRGYEYSKDRYVRVAKEDFDKLPVPTKHTVELRSFVSAEQIDPIFYEKSYFLEPEPAGRKPYALLVRALTEKALTAIAKITMREKEQLCAVRPHGGGMVLETLYYPDEIRKMQGLDTSSVDVSQRELDMAFQLVDYLSTDFNPTHYRDEYRDQLLALIEGKQDRAQVVSTPRAPQDNVIDLMEALKASLEAAQPQKNGAEKPPSRSRKKAA
jgi:DNA end-binding protein Ku